MDILVLGGTGAMGKPLVNILSKGNNVFVTSRSKKENSDNVTFIKGNGRNKEFLLKVLEMKHWDAIVDFLVRNMDELETELPIFLKNTKQYVFISSARVYAESNEPIKEDSPRLLDVTTDKEYLKTNEYALAKAREEDLLLDGTSQNFTIIRPSITYNSHRLQLGVFEKEEWLYRAMHGRTIIFSDDIADKITTNTWGYDVSRAIASVIGRSDALGKVFHITQPESLSWRDVLNIFSKVIEKHLGEKVKVKYTRKSTAFHFKNRKYQIIYCRYFNRKFDNSKIGHFIDTDSFLSTHEGLEKCLDEFFSNPTFGDINWELEAIHDRIAGEKTPLNEISGCTAKLTYLLFRYNLEPVYKFILKLYGFTKKLKK